jgi:hypothetical protein
MDNRECPSIPPAIEAAGEWLKHSGPQSSSAPASFVRSVRTYPRALRDGSGVEGLSGGSSPAALAPAKPNLRCARVTQTGRRRCTAVHRPPVGATRQ